MGRSGARRRSGSTRAEAAAGGFSGFEGGHSMDTVLIVEDDISNMQVFSLLLSSWTYKRTGSYYRGRPADGEFSPDFHSG